MLKQDSELETKILSLSKKITSTYAEKDSSYYARVYYKTKYLGKGETHSTYRIFTADTESDLLVQIILYMKDDHAYHII